MLEDPYNSHLLKYGILKLLIALNVDPADVPVSPLVNDIDNNDGLKTISDGISINIWFLEALKEGNDPCLDQLKHLYFN